MVPQESVVAIFISMTPIINYHKHTFIVFQFETSEVQYKSHWAKIKVIVGLNSFRNL